MNSDKENIANTRCETANIDIILEKERQNIFLQMTPEKIEFLENKCSHTPILAMPTHSN